jgi:hypothetical protein
MSRMHTRGLVALLVALVAVVGCAGHGPEPPDAGGAPRAAVSFDEQTPGVVTSLTPGGSREGGAARWAVVVDETAPSPPHVLEQQDARGEEPRLAVALAAAPIARDVRVSVRCQPLSGRLDQSAGLVFRATSDHDYYVVRANLLERSVVLYSTVKGERTQIAIWERRLAYRRWHALEAEARGDHIVVRWNGEVVIDVRDTTITSAGRAGVWTKADSVARFDDLVIESLDR